MNYTVIIFDMDGVLFNSIPFAWSVFSKKYPSVTEDMYKEISTGNFHKEVEKYSHLKIEQTKTEEEKESDRKQYSQEKSKTSLFPGINTLLTDLFKSGYILGLNTSALERNCVPMLKENNIYDLFDFIGTAEVSKSKVEKFRIIEDKYMVNKKNILFITDALGDVREADIAGISTIAVTWGIHNKSFFEREEHSNLISIVDTVSELEYLIKKK